MVVAGGGVNEGVAVLVLTRGQGGVLAKERDTRLRVIGGEEVWVVRHFGWVDSVFESDLAVHGYQDNAQGIFFFFLVKTGTATLRKLATQVTRKVEDGPGRELWTKF